MRLKQESKFIACVLALIFCNACTRKVQHIQEPVAFIPEVLARSGGVSDGQIPEAPASSLPALGEERPHD